MTLGKDTPTCETFRCKKPAIGYEQIGKWHMRLCAEHASSELIKMNPGEEVSTEDDYRYRYITNRIGKFANVGDVIG